MARPLRIEYPGAFDHIISRGMRQLNGIYAQFFNCSHNRSGWKLPPETKSLLLDKP